VIFQTGLWKCQQQAQNDKMNHTWTMWSKIIEGEIDVLFIFKNRIVDFCGSTLFEYADGILLSEYALSI